MGSAVWGGGDGLRGVVVGQGGGGRGLRGWWSGKDARPTDGRTDGLAAGAAVGVERPEEDAAGEQEAGEGQQQHGGGEAGVGGGAGDCLCGNGDDQQDGMIHEKANCSASPASKRDGSAPS